MSRKHLVGSPSLLHCDRTCDARQTLARLRPHFSKLGISRLGELTGLDYLGIPVALAVRPNSHSLSVSLGKGPDTDSALISAAMEAAETAVAEWLPRSAIWATADALESNALPLVDLFGVARCHPLKFLPTDQTAWIKTQNLIDNEDVFVPWSLIGMDHRVTPRGYHDAFYVASDGLASGNTKDEAVFHALCELVERDALTKFQFASTSEVSDAEFRPQGHENSQLLELLQLIDDARLRLRMFEMRTDLGLPTCMALLQPKHKIHDDEQDSGVSCGGCASHPDPGRAIVKAITEAAQARLALVAGARDDIRAEHYETDTLNTFPEPQDPKLLDERQFGADHELGWAHCIDLQEHIAELVQRLANAGINQVLVADLDTGDLAFEVVRVVATQLQVPLQGHRVQVTERGLKHVQEQAA